jgi:tRNA-uridine 2-sulfurtransferase
MRCLALFTGGLDAQLAVRLMQQQRIEVIGLYVATPLCATDSDRAEAAAAGLGIRLLTARLDGEYCELVRRPRFGRLDSGAPCVDCRIALFAKAAQLRTDCRADFVISGEVVGQRPRTALGDLEVLAHHAGLEGLLVRPLSASLLPPTLPEQRGWIDRGRLHGLHGKSRKPQHGLAEQLSIQPLPPRADCPLLGETLGRRVFDLLNSQSPLTSWDLELAPIGRHDAVGEATRIVVARNRAECETLARLAERSDHCTLLAPLDFTGPTALVVGPVTPAARQRAAALVARPERPAAADSRRIVATRHGAAPEIWEVAGAVEVA